MSGRWLTKSQVGVYMKSRKEGQIQVVSAAKSGVSEPSGRAIEKGQRVDPGTKDRTWRTRLDPFARVVRLRTESQLAHSKARRCSH
jgi:hypothetical protein